MESSLSHLMQTWRGTVFRTGASDLPRSDSSGQIQTHASLSNLHASTGLFSCFELSHYVISMASHRWACLSLSPLASQLSSFFHTTSLLSFENIPTNRTLKAIPHTRKSQTIPNHETSISTPSEEPCTCFCVHQSSLSHHRARPPFPLRFGIFV